MSFFSADKLEKLRQKAQEACQALEEIPWDFEGWRKSPVDPNGLVEVFQPLRLRKGYVFRAYVFRSHGNGNGVVWAMPEDAEFPDLKDCPILKDHPLKPPKPAGALDDAMEAVEGDGSAWSYLMASLLHRELREFGALWHGVEWETHSILDGDPWKGGLLTQHLKFMEDRGISAVREWKWSTTRPTDWRPQVKVDGNRVTVTFYTYSALHKEQIYRHSDIYVVGRYRPMTIERKTVAEGPLGFLF